MATPDDRDIDKLINEGRLRRSCDEPAFLKCYTCGFESDNSFLECPGCGNCVDIKITCKSCKGITLKSGDRECQSIEQFKVKSILPFPRKKTVSNPKPPVISANNTANNKQKKSAEVYIPPSEADEFEIDISEDLASDAEQIDSFSDKSRGLKSDKPKLNIFNLFSNANIYTSLGTILCCLMGVVFFPDVSFGLFANIALNIFGISDFI